MHRLGPLQTDRLLGAWDIGYFARAFLPHYCREPESGFHRELYRLLLDRITAQSGSRIAVAAPRESAKSTIAALFLPLWCICYPRRAGKRFILIAGDTEAQAEQHIADLRSELEGNVRLREAFGESIGRGELWTRGSLVTAGGIKLLARGTGGYVRGVRHRQHRPDLLIGDDLENDRNSRKQVQRDQITEWFFKAFCKAGTKQADIIVVGTILHQDSLLSRLLENPAFLGRKYRGVIRWSRAVKLWEEWENIYTDPGSDFQVREARADEFYQDHKQEMLDGTEVLWPGRKDYYDMMKLKVAEGELSFNSEIQNEPATGRECIFPPEWFAWFDEEDLDPDSLVTFAGCGPSLGKSGAGGDPSALVCLGRDRKGILYVLDADIRWRTPDRIIGDALELHCRRGLAALGVEEVQFQEFFKDRLAQAGRERGIYVPVRGIKTTRDKIIRIQRLQPLIKAGTIRFQKTQRTLLEQLRHFPDAEHDDGPDALEMAFQMIEHFHITADFRFDGPRKSEQQLNRIFR